MHKTLEEWKDEVDYIKRIATTRALGLFNNDPHCFRRYMILQKSLAHGDGQLSIIKEIDKAFLEFIENTPPEKVSGT